MANETCNIHEGFKARIQNLEENVRDLWDKWNGLQKIIITLLLTNLIGVIIILIRNTKF